MARNTLFRGTSACDAGMFPHVVHSCGEARAAERHSNQWKVIMSSIAVPGAERRPIDCWRQDGHEAEARALCYCMCFFLSSSLQAAQALGVLITYMQQPKMGEVCVCVCVCVHVQQHTLSQVT